MSFVKLCLFQIIMLLSVFAQAQYPFLKKIDIEEENLTIKATSLIKDHNGFLWIGTSEGLFKFSAAAPQKIINQDPDSRFYITSLLEDSDGVIWAGCRNGSIITVKNQQTELFMPAEGLPQNTITSIIQDKKKRLWFATAGEGIYFTDGRHLHHITAADGLSDDNVNCLLPVNEDEIIAGTDRGLSFINAMGTKKITGVFTAKDGLTDNIIKNITSSANKNIIWVGTQSKGIVQFNINSRQIAQIPAAWRYGQVNNLLESNHALFIATEENGMICYDEATGVFKKNIFKDSGEVKRVTDIQTDNEENVWLAADNKLVSYTGLWLTYWMGDTHTPFAKVHTLFADENNTLWFTPDFGLYEGRMLLEGSNTGYRSFDITPPEELIDITCIYKDRFGYLWVGTMGRGVYRMNPNTGDKRQVAENAITNNGHILSIAGKKDEVWISTLNGVARFYLEEKHSSLDAKFNYTNYSKKDGLGSDYIYNILVDSKNRTWFATDGAGICVYEHNLFLNYYTSKLFPSKVAYSLAEDKAGHIWISTYNDGLFEFDEKKFTQYDLRNGLTDLAITAIATDNYDNVIAINKKGIDILNPRKNIVQHIGAESGFTEEQPNLNSISKDKSGNIWIGTEKGIVRLAPPPSFGNVLPSAVIESVQLFATSINTKIDSVFLYNQNSFSFKIAAAYYKAPEKLKFQYWLKGLGNRWETTSDRVITFSQLTPGHYTFRVRASVNENFDSSPVVEYSFTIKRSFWTTWWFKTILFLAAIGLLYGVVTQRIKSVRKKENALREKFQLQYDALKHQVNPHFLFNSFNALLNIVEDNPREAAVLIKHLSQFYRKMTASGKKELILVEEEMELLYSYLYIQQKRFGNALQFSESLEPWIKKSTFIPPLVLQLLAENAVKHNTVSRENPLTIQLYVEDDYLVMKNNIIPKIEKEESEGVGLHNIENRYKLLTVKPVIKKYTNNEFIIMLPLIYLN